MTAGADLVALLAEAPDDPERHAVYADYLQDRGDPRGLLIATQLALSRAGSDAERYPLSATEASLFDAHGPALYGPLFSEPRGALRWQWGFARRAGAVQPQAARALLAHDVGRLVRELVIAEVASRHELDTLLALARSSAPHLQRLIFNTTGALAEELSARPPRERFAVEVVAVPTWYSLSWLTVPERDPAELWLAALRWRVGVDPGRHRRARSDGTIYADRYGYELLCGATDDAWVARELLAWAARDHHEPAGRPGAGALELAAPLRAHASARVAIALWRYIEHHLEISYDRRIVRDHPRLFWPLVPLWHPLLETRLAGYLAGALDRTPAQAGVRHRRARLIAWLCSHVEAPNLAAAAATVFGHDH